MLEDYGSESETPSSLVIFMEQINNANSERKNSEGLYSDIATAGAIA